MSWINAEKELPDIDIPVLIRVKCLNYHNIESGMYIGSGEWVNCWFSKRNKDIYPVTHWMEYPEPPEEV